MTKSRKESDRSMKPLNWFTAKLNDDPEKEMGYSEPSSGK